MANESVLTDFSLKLTVGACESVVGSRYRLYRPYISIAEHGGRRQLAEAKAEWTEQNL